LAGIDSENPMIGHDLTKPVPVEKQRALMQRDKNYAWMTANNDVVVIQPEKGISTYKYHPEDGSMVAAAVSNDVVTIAHANAMWGNLAFDNNYYTAQKSYAIEE